MKKSLQKQTGELVIYQTKEGGVKLRGDFSNDTLWANLNEIAQLFDTDKSGISRHINNLYKSGELERLATVAKIATVQNESGRDVERNIEYFNLDAILSVGYRVNSAKATQFRIWATRTLKDHLLKGYTVNEKRLKEQANCQAV
jgi:hypothetical protein